MRLMNENITQLRVSGPSGAIRRMRALLALAAACFVLVALPSTALAVDTAPTANDDSYSTDEDTALTVPADGVLGNDTDPDGDALSAVLVDGPAHASAFTLNADGSFTYTPAPNYNGGDSFTYKANDAT